MTALTKPVIHNEAVKARWRRVAPLLWVLPLLYSAPPLALWGIEASRNDEVLRGVPVVLVPLLWALLSRGGRFNPQGWPGSLFTGALITMFCLGIGAYMGAGVDLTAITSGPLTIMAVLTAVAVGPPAVMWLLGRAMRNYAMGPDKAELIDTPFPVTFTAEGDRKLKLTIAPEEISFEYGSGSKSSQYANAKVPLGDVDGLRLGPVVEERRAKFHGADHWTVPLQTGQSLRIGFGDEERDWIFRTEEGLVIAKMIQARMQAAEDARRARRQQV